MIKTRKAPTEAQRLEIVAASVKAKMTIPQMQKIVDETIDKVIGGTASELEEQRAAVLAAIIKDRTGGIV